MGREEFLRRLNELLAGISEEERTDALAFYRSYFEDAGPENEASILKELESPEKVAESILKNLGADGNSGAQGGAAECGAGRAAGGMNAGAQGSRAAGGMNTGSAAYSQYGMGAGAGGMNGSYGRYGGAAGMNGSYHEDSTGKTILIVVLLVLTSPVWLTMIMAAAGILLGAVASVFGIVIAAVAVVASLVFVGFLLAGIGISGLFGGSAVIGLGLLGCGLIVLAFGVVAVIALVWLLGGFMPWAYRGLRDCFRDWNSRRKECRGI